MERDKLEDELKIIFEENLEATKIYDEQTRKTKEWCNRFQEAVEVDLQKVLETWDLKDITYEYENSGISFNGKIEK